MSTKSKFLDKDKLKTHEINFLAERLEYANRQIQHRDYVCKKTVASSIEELNYISIQLRKLGL